MYKNRWQDRRPGAPRFGAVIAAVVEEIGVGLDHFGRDSGIQPDLDLLGPHLQPLFDHDIDRIGQEVLVFEADPPVHLGFYRPDQMQTVCKIIEANDRQVVFNRGGFFDQPRDPAVRPDLGDAKPAGVGDGLYPGHRIRFFGAQKRQVRFHERVGKYHQHGPIG